MKKLLVLTAVVFLGAFAVGVGGRVAAETRALVAGIAIGAVASVPAVIIVAAYVRRPKPEDEEETHSRAGARPLPVPPSVVIVSPGQAPRSVRYPPYLVSEPPEAPLQRHFTIVDNEEKDGKA